MRILPPKRISWLFIVMASIALPACANLELAQVGEIITGKESSPDYKDDQEIALGKNLATEFLRSRPLFPAEEVSRFVQEVGDRLSRTAPRKKIPYTITVINEPAIRSFSFPGGQIFIYRGLLENLENEAQLAAIIAHEMAHQTAKNPARTLRNAPNAFNYTPLTASTDKEIDFIDKITSHAYDTLSQGYGPKEELGADAKSVDHLAEAGYNPQGVLELLGILERESLNRPLDSFDLVASHPPFPDRISNVRKALKKRPASVYPVADRAYRTRVIEVIQAQREGASRRYVSSILAKRVDRDGTPIDEFTSMHWRDNDIHIIVNLKDMDTAPHSLSISFFAQQQRIGHTSVKNFKADKSDWTVPIRVMGLGDTALINKVMGPWKASIYLDSYQVDTIDFEITQ